MENKIKKQPIIGPLLGLLRSRKFIVGLMTILVTIVVAYVPALEEAQGELITVFTVIGSLIIAGIAYEDGQSSTDRGTP